MATRLNPYLTFDGDAREAMETYQRVLGGELTISTFAELGGGGEDGPPADGVMHAMLETPDGFTLMASDTPPGMTLTRGDDVSISLSGEDGDTLRRWWEQLADGGTITMPLERQMWGDDFGMLTDRFGVHWMVNIAGSPPA